VPFVLLCGSSLSTEQATKLREYLMRGGFLFFDDFWGEYEWTNVQEQFHKIVPNTDQGSTVD